MAVHPFEFAADDPEKQHIPENMGNIGVQERGGKKLPDVSVAEDRVASGCAPFGEKPREFPIGWKVAEHEHDDVHHDQPLRHRAGREPGRRAGLTPVILTVVNAHDGSGESRSGSMRESAGKDLPRSSYHRPARDDCQRHEPAGRVRSRKEGTKRSGQACVRPGGSVGQERLHRLATSLVHGPEHVERGDSKKFAAWSETPANTIEPPWAFVCFQQRSKTATNIDPKNSTPLRSNRSVGFSSRLNGAMMTSAICSSSPASSVSRAGVTMMSVISPIRSIITASVGGGVLLIESVDPGETCRGDRQRARGEHLSRPD